MSYYEKLSPLITTIKAAGTIDNPIPCKPGDIRWSVKHTAASGQFIAVNAVATSGDDLYRVGAVSPSQHGSTREIVVELDRKALQSFLDNVHIAMRTIPSITKD